jgi:hypothetical protein
MSLSTKAPISGRKIRSGKVVKTIILLMFALTDTSVFNQSIRGAVSKSQSARALYDVQSTLRLGLCRTRSRLVMKTPGKHGVLDEFSKMGLAQSEQMGWDEQP